MFLDQTPINPLWFSVSAAAKISGVDPKTIRRAIKNSHALKYRVTKNRYQIELGSLFSFTSSNTKLKNKFYKQGLGQYLDQTKTT